MDRLISYRSFRLSRKRRTDFWFVWHTNWGTGGGRSSSTRSEKPGTSASTGSSRSGLVPLRIGPFFAPRCGLWRGACPAAVADTEGARGAIQAACALDWEGARNRGPGAPSVTRLVSARCLFSSPADFLRAAASDRHQRRDLLESDDSPLLCAAVPEPVSFGMQGGKRKSTAGAVTPSAQAPALKKHKRGWAHFRGVSAAAESRRPGLALCSAAVEAGGVLGCAANRDVDVKWNAVEKAVRCAERTRTMPAATKARDTVDEFSRAAAWTPRPHDARFAARRQSQRGPLPTLGQRGDCASEADHLRYPCRQLTASHLATKSDQLCVAAQIHPTCTPRASPVSVPARMKHSVSRAWHALSQNLPASVSRWPLSCHPRGRRIPGAQLPLGSSAAAAALSLGAFDTDRPGQWVECWRARNPLKAAALLAVH